MNSHIEALLDRKETGRHETYPPKAEDEVMQELISVLTWVNQTDTKHRLSPTGSERNTYGSAVYFSVFVMYRGKSIVTLRVVVTDPDNELPGAFITRPVWTQADVEHEITKALSQ